MSFFLRHWSLRPWCLVGAISGLCCSQSCVTCLPEFLLSMSYTRSKQDLLSHLCTCYLVWFLLPSNTVHLHGSCFQGRTMSLTIWNPERTISSDELWAWKEQKESYPASCQEIGSTSYFQARPGRESKLNLQLTWLHCSSWLLTMDCMRVSVLNVWEYISCFAGRNSVRAIGKYTF